MHVERVSVKLTYNFKTECQSGAGDLRESKSPVCFPLTLQTHEKLPACPQQPWSFGTTSCFTSKCVHRKQRYHRSRVSPNYSSLILDNGSLFFTSKTSKKWITEPNVASHRTEAHDTSLWVPVSWCKMPKAARGEGRCPVSRQRPLIPRQALRVLMSHQVPSPHVTLSVNERLKSPREESQELVTHATERSPAKLLCAQWHFSGGHWLCLQAWALVGSAYTLPAVSPSLCSRTLCDVDIPGNKQPSSVYVFCFSLSLFLPLCLL